MKNTLKVVLASLKLGLLLCTPIIALGQQTTVQAKFIIQDARLNKADITEHVLKSKSYLAVYTVKGDTQPKFANVMASADTQSYGNIFDLVGETKEATDNTYKTESYSFKWSYINDYDNKKGTAIIKLLKITKDVGIAFECTIIPENLDVIVYKGYMEGSLNFKNQ